MQDSWEKNPPNLKVGEPVTRTIIMQVKGLASSQIPEIFIPKPMGMKVYPEQAKGETPNDGNTIYGIQRVDISYIPDKSGPVVIPEITVDWWDVNNKQQQTYTLPEWNLNVEAGAAATIEAESEPMVMDDVNPEAEVSIEEVFITAPSYWGWEALLAVLAVIAILLWSLTHQVNKRIKKSPKRVLKNKKKNDLIAERRIKISLLKACEANDNKTAAELLIKHAQALSPDLKIQNLGILKNRLIKGTTIIKQLEASLYASDSQHWNGTDLHRLVSQGLSLKENVKNSQTIGLAPLYPN